MSAEIIGLAEFRARRAGQTANSSSEGSQSFADTSPRFHFWTGASGRRYVHTVYSLFDCPPLGIASYVLVRRTSRNERSVLALGRLSHEQASMNLAEIRQRAATVGADEVHVHLLATSLSECQAVEIDLRTAQFAARAN
ncbi:MAG: hypothetical protein ABL897_05170 [Hyphomicrobium sp.]